MIELLISPSYEAMEVTARQLCEQGVSIDEAVEQATARIILELVVTEEIESLPVVLS